MQQADRIHRQGAVGGEAAEESGAGQESDPAARAAVRPADRQAFDQRPQQEGADDVDHEDGQRQLRADVG